MKKLNHLKYFVLVLLGVFSLASCTDLEIEETDSIIDDGFQGLDDPASALTQLYNNVYGQWGDQANRYALYEVTTDALLVPTRGADWGDNGRWRKLHQHNWGLEETDILTPFSQYSQDQLLASQILDSRSGASPDVAAQAKFLRAYAMFTMLDLYGQVPFRDVTLPSSSVPEVLTGVDAVNFIIQDLDDAISGLPSVSAGTGDLKRASQAAARFLKAKVLLNKHIYVNQLTGGGGTPDSGDLQAVVSLVDAIEADGFALEDDYFGIFDPTADTETIWWAETGVGNRIYNGLHYNSNASTTGWNGFSTLAEYYDLFEGDENQNRLDAPLGNPLDGQEDRRGGVPPSGIPDGEGGYLDGTNVGLGFLIGQQYALDGTPLTDRPGAPLVFSRDFVDGSGNKSLINNDEKTGIRVQKYKAANDGGFTAHNIVFRYADAYLMKAEAMFRLGQGDPLSMVNNLRSIRGAQTVLGSLTEQDLLDERARELYAEGWRRNDMIRFGQYLREWEFKEDTDVKRLLFPIPLPQLLGNPNLVQNPGY